MKPLPIVTLLALAAVHVHCGGPSHEGPAGEERPPVRVATTQVRIDDLRARSEAGGVVRARATAVVAARLLAPVLQVHVRPGDRVRQGAPLVTLDDRALRAGVSGAQASLAAASDNVRAAAADVQAAQAALQLARATHQRISGLHARKSATPQELDQATQALESAEAAAAGAAARAAAAGAALDAARAAGDAAAVNASYSVLRAPFDGVVTERSVDPGSMAAPGVPLLVVEDAAAYRLEVQLDEARGAAIRVGDAVDVRIDRLDTGGEADAWAPARVTEIARLDPQSHRFLVKADLPARDGLRSGLYGRARFAGEPRRALTVPERAVVRRGQLSFVYAVGSDGRAHLRPVTVGGGGDGRLELLAGAREGDTLVDAPPPALAEGARVTTGQGAGGVR